MSFPPLLHHFRSLHHHTHTSILTLVRHSRRAHKPIKHPRGLDQDWRNGPVHVRPPHPSWLHSHHLQPHPFKSPTPPRYGGPPGPLPQVLASRSDVVFSIVGYPSDVRSVLLYSTSGALAGLRPGGILIDMTTSEPSVVQLAHIEDRF